MWYDSINKLPRPCARGNPADKLVIPPLRYGLAFIKALKRLWGISASNNKTKLINIGSIEL